jgi:hypothetical protein
MATGLVCEGWLDGGVPNVGHLGALRVCFDCRRPFGKLCGDYSDALCAVRCPKLPPPGEAFRSVCLRKLAVKDESPAMFRALLEPASARPQPTGRHFFTFELDDGDPLEPAHKGFMARTLGFQLFAVTPAAVRRTEWPAGHTGFAVSLA